MPTNETGAPERFASSGSGVTGWCRAGTQYIGR